MATEKSNGSVYDKGLGSEQRSAVAATKLWAIVLGIVLVIGIVLIAVFFFSGSSGTRGYGVGGANSTTSSPGP